MTARVDVSIVCLTFNHEEYVGDALEGFLSQRYDDINVEILVGDDASTDRTPNIVAEYAARNSGVIRPLLREKNVGIQQNLLDVLFRVRGRYIAFCEGDDYWTDPEKIKTQYHMMESNPEATISFHDTQVRHTGAMAAPSLWPDLGPSPDLSVVSLIRKNFIPMNSVMYRNVLDVGLLPSTNILPYDRLLHIMHATRGEIIYIPRPMSVYRKHPGGVWWEGEGRAHFWERNALPYMRLYEHLGSIFHDSPDMLTVVEVSATETLERLVREVGEEGLSTLMKVSHEFPRYTSLVLLSGMKWHEAYRMCLEGSLWKRAKRKIRRSWDRAGDH